MHIHPLPLLTAITSFGIGAQAQAPTHTPPSPPPYLTPNEDGRATITGYYDIGLDLFGNMERHLPTHGSLITQDSSETVMALRCSESQPDPDKLHTDDPDESATQTCGPGWDEEGVVTLTIRRPSSHKIVYGYTRTGRDFLGHGTFTTSDDWNMACTTTVTASPTTTTDSQAVLLSGLLPQETEARCSAVTSDQDIEGSRSTGVPRGSKAWDVTIPLNSRPLRYEWKTTTYRYKISYGPYKPEPTDTTAMPELMEVAVTPVPMEITVTGGFEKTQPTPAPVEITVTEVFEKIQPTPTPVEITVTGLVSKKTWRIPTHTTWARPSSSSASAAAPMITGAGGNLLMAVGGVVGGVLPYLAL